MIHEGLRDVEGKMVIQFPIRQQGFGCQLCSGHTAIDFHNIHAPRSGAERQQSTRWLTQNQARISIGVRQLSITETVQFLKC